MPPLSTILSHLPTLATTPTVVAFTGGTTGIGSYITQTLATTFAHHGSNLRVYLIGRNATRAASLLANGRATSPGSEWFFLPVDDLALMRDVDAVSTEIARRETESPFRGGEPRVDVFYMCQALSPLQESKGESLFFCRRSGAGLQSSVDPDR